MNRVPYHKIPTIKRSRSPIVLSSYVYKVVFIPPNDFEDVYYGLDIFDFGTYKLDFDMMKQYFTGFELYIRTAIWIGYKYGHLTVPQQHELDQQLSNRPNKVSWLKTMTDITEPEQLMYSWTKHFNPSILWKFDSIYEKYIHFPYLYLHRSYKRNIDPHHEPRNDF